VNVLIVDKLSSEVVSALLDQSQSDSLVDGMRNNRNILHVTLN